MSVQNETTSPAGAPPRNAKVVKALRRFAISMTVFNIIGYAYLGFEQPWLWPFIALATGYTTEIVLEIIGARAEGRAPRFRGNGVRGVVEFLFPAHITSLAVNMLIYVNDQILAMMFGVVVAVGAKWVFRAPVRGRLRHFMNPSNFGIAMIFFVFPWASIAPPYQFTIYGSPYTDWIVPLAIIFLGTMLNAKLTGRMWLIAGWVSFFAIQSVVRGLVTDVSMVGALGTMTGVAFILFTNYMITDPGTSPSKPGAQFAFGAGVAVTYGLLTGMNIAYGLFFATAAVCAVRGGFLWALHFVQKAAELQRSQQEQQPLTGSESATPEQADGAPIQFAPAAKQAEPAAEPTRRAA